MITKKEFFDLLIIITALLWIPLGVFAFFISDTPINVKLLVASGFSFAVLLVIWLKESY